MANIYALQGPGNYGKTRTLIDLLNKITSKYPSAIVQNFHGGTNDIKIVVHPVNGFKIGVESQGDPGSRLKQSLADFRAANCDIVFCACRTKGMTVHWVSAMSPPDSIQFIQQVYSASSHQSANSAMASHLMQVAGI